MRKANGMALFRKKHTQAVVCAKYRVSYIRHSFALFRIRSISFALGDDGQTVADADERGIVKIAAL